MRLGLALPMATTSTAPLPSGELRKTILRRDLGGFRNSFGQPRMEVLKRLEDSGAPVYRTDVNGVVTFHLDGHSVTPWLVALH